LLFALPTYAFIAAIGSLVVVGTVQVATGHVQHAVTPSPLATGAGAIGLFVLLRAFSSGSTALTGVEAIANGVNAFRRPHGRNAAVTLAVLGSLAIALFLGVSFLSVHTHAMPSSTASVVSQVARAVFRPGSVAGWMYYVVQGTTLLILVLAANTSFQGFPRLSALLARDGYAPRQFTNLGDRLVFSNGMLVLAVVAGLLLWIYGANTNSLIHLYVIGVFTAFTISQAGMVRYWLRVRGSGWKARLAVNAVGAVATGVVDVVVAVTKFAEGAWLVVVAVPLLVLVMLGVHRHYASLRRRLRAAAAAVVAARPATNTTLLVVERIDAATDEALWLTRTLYDGFRAVHVVRHGTDPGIRARWFRFADANPPLEVLPGADGSVEPVLEQVWQLPRGDSEFVTVVVPELLPSKSLLAQLRRPFELRLKLRLLTEQGVVVTSVPSVAGVVEEARSHAAVRILVSDVNAASMRAVNYARTLHADDLTAVHFAFSGDDRETFRRAWAEAEPRVPLEVLEAPYRDLADPLLGYLRDLTSERGTEVLVVMPELVFRGWRRVLHNQRALYVKRVLLLEPHVALASVPYQLLR
jgi:hypothetical protein